METTLIIVVIIALVAFSMVCAVAVSTLRRVSDLMLDVNATIDEAKRLVFELNRSLPKTLDSIQEMSTQATETMKEASEQLEVLGSGIEDFKAIGSRINQLELRLQQKIEGPLMQAASVVSGISKAISVFANGVSRKDKN